MNKSIDWNLVIKYLENTCSKEEENELMEWASQDRENAKELDLLKRVWNIQDRQYPKPDVEKALAKVKQRIYQLSTIGEIKNDKVIEVNAKPKKNYFTFPIFIKAAAVILILIIGIYLIIPTTTSSKMKILSVENKMMEEIILDDDSKIILDAGSILKYPEKFENELRTVFLSGEAYFNISPDREKPFIIYAAGAEIKVLGTKFNVRAWKPNHKVTVAVKRGEVSLQTQGRKSNVVIISKDQVSYIDENGLPSEPMSTDVNQHLAWMRREFKFQSTPLQEILNQLTRWYDIDFSLPEKSFGESRITIFIENKPIENILKLICLIMNFDYTLNGSKVIFIQKE